MSDELSIQLGVELDIDSIRQQLDGLKNGKDNKIQISANTKEAEQKIKDLKKLASSGQPAKIVVDVLKGTSDANISSYINNIQNKYQNNPIKLVFGVDDKATAANIQNALQNVQKQAQQAAQAAVQAQGNTQANKPNPRTVIANTPTSVPIDKYTDELNKAIDRYQDAFSDKSFKVSGVRLMHDELNDSYRAAVQFKNALGETTDVMFRLQAIVDDEGKKIGDEWVTSGQKFAAVFKDSEKDVEKTFNLVQNKVNELNNIYSKAFGKNATKTLFFEDNDAVNAKFAEPALQQYNAVATILGNIQAAAQDDGIAHTAEDVRKLEEEINNLNIAIREAQQARWTSTDFKETDTTSFVERYKSLMVELSNGLKDDGVFDKFSAKISNMFSTLNDVKTGKASTGDFLNDLRNLKQEIKTFESSVKGRGVMDAFDIGEDQLRRIQNLNNILNGKDGTRGIEEYKKKLDDLAKAYEDLQNKMQARGVSRERLGNYEAQQAELDKQLAGLSTSVTKLNDQQWVATQEAGIEKMKAKFAEYREEISKTIQLPDELQTKLDSLVTTMGQDGAIDVANWKNVSAEFEKLIGLVDQFMATTQGMGNALAIDINASQVKDIDNLVQSLSSVSSASGTGVQQVIDDLNSLKTQYQEVIAQLNNPNITADQFTALSDKAKELDVQLQNLAKEASTFGNDNSIELYNQKIEGLKLNLEKLEQQYANLIKRNPEIASKFSALRENIENIRPGEIPTVTRELGNMGKECANLSGQVGGLRGALESAFGGLGSYIARFTSGYFVITKLISGVKSMVNEVKSVDTALVELQKVTDLTGASLDNFTQKAYQVGEGLGRTGKDVIDAATTFSRAGYDLNEATQLAQSALVMTNVGVDIKSTEAAASDMISILKAFDVQAEDSMKTIDKLYNVANKEPLDFGNITQMLVTAGGTLAQTGTSLEETMGLLTGAFATMRDTSVANGLIMISQRLRGVREDGEAIEEAGFMPKLKSMFADIGIEVETQNGELRSTFDILNDLAGKWDMLSSKQKQYFGEKVAGNRQVKTLNAIMQNWDVVADTIQKANEAEGAAMEGNELYMESIEGRITKLKSAFQELATTTINGDFVKGFVDLGTSLIKLTKNAGGLVPIITTLLGLFIAIKAQNFGTAIAAIGTAIKGLISGVGTATTLMSGWVGIIMAVASALAMIATGVVNANSSLKQLANAKKEYEDQKNKVEDLNGELKTTGDRITELEGKGPLTIVESKELENLKETNAELQKQIAYEEELLRIAEGRTKEKAVEHQEKEGKRTTKGSGVITYENSIPDYIVKSVGEDFLNKNVQNKENISGLTIYTPTQSEEIQVYLKALEEQTRQIQDLHKSIQNTDVNDTQTLDTLEKQLEEVEKQRNEVVKVLDEYKTGLDENFGQYDFTENAKEGSVDAKINGYKLLAKQIQDAVLASKRAFMSPQEMSDSIFEQFPEQLKAIKEQIKETGDFSADDLGKPQFEEMVQEFDKYGWKAEEVAQHVKEQFTVGNIDTSGLFDINIDELSLFSATDAYKNLTKAIQEQEKAGAISAETYKTLVDDEGLKGISEYLELTAKGYVLNTKSLYQFIKAQDQETKLKAVSGIMERQKALEELRSSNEDLTDAQQEQAVKLEQEIEYLKSVAIEADAAASALERYKAALKTPDADTEHTEGQGAAKTVKEKYKEGKVGSDDFQTGMAFFLGDDWLGKFEGNVDKAYKAFDKINNRYFGKSDAQSAKNFADDLVKKGFAEYEVDENGNKLLKLKEKADGTKLTLEDLANGVEGMADGFDMGTAAIQSMLDLLNVFQTGDYKIELGYEPTPEEKAQAQALENLNNKTQELADAQEKLNSMEPGTTEYGEQAKEVEKLKGEVEDAQTTVDNLDKALAEVGQGEETDPLSDLLTKLNTIKETISGLEETGITVPVTLTNEADRLETLISQIIGDPTFSITVNDVGDANEKIQELEAFRKAIENNPNISPEIKAKLSAATLFAIAMLKQYIQDSEKVENKTATITVSTDGDALGSGEGSISYLKSETDELDTKNYSITLDANGNAIPEANSLEKKVKELDENGKAEVDLEAKDEVSGKVKNAQEEIEHLDETDSNSTLDADNKASAKAEKAREDVEDIPESAETYISAQEDPTQNAAVVGADIQQTLDDLDPMALIEASLDPASKGKVIEEITDLTKPKEIKLKPVIDSDTPVTDNNGNPANDQNIQGILGQTNMPVAGVKNASGGYNYAGIIDYIAGVAGEFQKTFGRGPSGAELTSAVQGKIDSGLVAFSQDVQDALVSYIMDALERYAADPQKYIPESPEPSGPKGTGNKFDITPETKSVGKNVSNIVGKIPPQSVEIDADTEKMPEQISEAIGKVVANEPAVEVEAEVDTENADQQVEDAASKWEQYLMNAATMSLDAGVGNVGTINQTVNTDTTQSKSNIDALKNDAEAGAEMPVDANTDEAEDKINKARQWAEKTATTPVNANTSSAKTKIDGLVKEIEKKRTMNVEVKYTETNKPPEAATGLKNADAGLTLVDDGSGAELIEHVKRGTYELGTNDGPRLTMLDKGDVVHTAEETKKIMSRLGAVGGFFRNGLNKAKSIIGNAFAGGTTVSGSASMAAISRVLKSVTSGKNTSSSGGKSDSYKKFEKWAKNLFDWVEVRLNRLKTITNAWLTDVQMAVGSVAKNAKLDKAIRSVNKEIIETEKAYNEYIETANKVAKKSGLSKSYQTKVQNGTIDVEKLKDEKLKKKIEEYKKWYISCHLAW